MQLAAQQSQQQHAWSQHLNLVREAINALSSGVERLQRPADAWLQQFTASPGSWRLLVRLLEASNLQPNECFFAASNIRSACLKHVDVLEVVTLSELLPQLAFHLQACLHRQQWAPANQLAAAIAALAARSPSMQADMLPQILSTIFSPTVAQALTDAAAATSAAANSAAAAAAVAAAGPQQQPPMAVLQPRAQWLYSARHGSLPSPMNPATATTMAAAAASASARSQELLQVQLQQEPMVLAALLQVLAALPDVVRSRHVVWHAFDRRDAVRSSLLASNALTLVVAAALCSQNSRFLLLSCDVLINLCELGGPPHGLEAQAGALQVLAGGILVGMTSARAADAMAALAGSCKGSAARGSVAGVRWQLLLQILQQLQYAEFPALKAQHEAMAGRTGAVSSGSVEGGAPLDAARAPQAVGVCYSSVAGTMYGPDAEFAVCKMLAAVAAALLTHVAQGAEPPPGALDQVLQQLLLCVAAEDDGAAMLAVNFWQEEYVAQLLALPSERQAAVLLGQQPVLQALSAALVRRTELVPSALMVATADARDLPEGMRLIRRELAAALRDVGVLVGRHRMLSHMVQLVEAHHQALTGLLGSAGVFCLMLTGEAAQATAGSVSAPVAAAFAHLEGALYAANVVLGRLCDVSSPEVEGLVQQLVQLSSQAATSYTYIHKLTGTALTLLGGLSAWLLRHQAQLPAVLHAAVVALRSHDDKLSRNAATCLQRLTASDQLAALVYATQPGCVQQLLEEYQRRGGVPVTHGPVHGDDRSTEELLLLSLCSIAVAHSSSTSSGGGSGLSDISSILQQLVGPQLLAATQELNAALEGRLPQHMPSVLAAPSPPQPQLRQHPRARRPAQPQPPQPPQPLAAHSSKAIHCFGALAKLVAGLPTGVANKYSIGVPMHVRHARHEQQLRQVAGVLGLQLPAAAAAAQQPQHAAAAASVGGAAGSSASPSGSEGSSGGQQHTAGRPGAMQGLAALLHVGQGRQHPHLTVERQQHACLFVSQLLQQAQPAVMLALQAAVGAACEQEAAWYSSQLLSAVSCFLQAALPAALQYQLLAAGSAAAQGAEGEGSTGHGLFDVRPEPGSQGAAAAAAAAGPTVLEPAALVMQLCLMVEKLPQQLLEETAGLQLLLMVVVCAAVTGTLPDNECLDLEVLARLPQPQQPPRLRPLQQDTQQQLQQLVLLQRLVGSGLSKACKSIIEQQGSADEDCVAAALSLASVSVQLCPAVLAGVDLGLLLQMTLAASRTTHLKQVTALLDWMQLAVFAAFVQVQPVWYPSGASAPAPASSMTRPDAAAGAAAQSGTSRGLLTTLRMHLEGGLGAQLVLALLLAASGAMPPDVVLPVSLCLHSMWLTVGPQLFEAWLQAAVLQLAPEAATWASLRPMFKLQFIQNVTESGCLTDTTKFKGIIKSFCGGKHKVPGRY